MFLPKITPKPWILLRSNLFSIIEFPFIGQKRKRKKKEAAAWAGGNFAEMFFYYFSLSFIREMKTAKIKSSDFTAEKVENR